MPRKSGWEKGRGIILSRISTHKERQTWVVLVSLSPLCYDNNTYVIIRRRSCTSRSSLRLRFVLLIVRLYRLSERSWTGYNVYNVYNSYTGVEGNFHWWEARGWNLTLWNELLRIHRGNCMSCWMLNPRSNSPFWLDRSWSFKKYNRVCAV